MSMMGRWDPWYAGMADREPYGDVTTYIVAEQFLGGLAVEDWGCGSGYFGTVHDGQYTGVDGSGRWAHVHTDLTRWRSTVPGILIRHVLEHNPDWDSILANAAASFTDTLVVVLFVPPVESGPAVQVGWNDHLQVPDLALPHDRLAEVCSDWMDLATDTQYGFERVYVGRR